MNTHDLVMFSSSALLLLLCTACGEAVVDDATPADARDEAFLVDGRADNLGVSDELADEILLFVNVAPEVELDQDAGLDRRSAREIRRRRVGADGFEGTGDDVPFEALEELDAIPYVGPVSFNRLAKYVDEVWEPSSADVHGIREQTLDARAVLQVANGRDLETLDDDVSLDARAARSIVDHRQGADGRDGTSDDDRFDTLEELAAVPWVGKRAFEKLIDYVRRTNPHRQSDDPFSAAYCLGEPLPPGSSDSGELEWRIRTRTCWGNSCSEWYEYYGTMAYADISRDEDGEWHISITNNAHGDEMRCDIYETGEIGCTSDWVRYEGRITDHCLSLRGTEWDEPDFFGNEDEIQYALAVRF